MFSDVNTPPPHPSPALQPMGLLGWRVLWLQHPKLWQVAVNRFYIPGVLSDWQGFRWILPLFPCRLLLLLCKTDPTYFIHILFIARSAILKQNSWDLQLCIFSSTRSLWDTLGDFSSLSPQPCLLNNLALSIPLKLIGFSEREWEIGYQHWVK